MVSKEVKLVREFHAGHFHGLFVQRGKTDGVGQGRGPRHPGPLLNLVQKAPAMDAVARGTSSPADTLHRKKQRRTLRQERALIETMDGTRGNVAGQ